MNAQQTLTEVNTVLDGISVAMPQFFAVYNAIKLIWTVANPGKTEADFHQYLMSQAAKTTQDADAILTAHGYTRDPATGSWSKGSTVVTPVAPSPVPPVPGT